MSCSFSRQRRLFTISHGTHGTRFKSHAKLFWDGQILTFFCCLHGLQSLFLPLRCHWLGWWIRKVRIKFRLRFWQEFNFCVFQIYNEYTTVYNSLWMCVVSGLIDLYWRSGLSGTRKSEVGSRHLMGTAFQLIFCHADAKQSALETLFFFVFLHDSRKLWRKLLVAAATL